MTQANINKKSFLLEKELGQLKQRFPNLDYNLIDLYLGGSLTSVAHPSIRATYYLSHFTSNLPNHVVQAFKDESTAPTSTRSQPITPLRTAWEMGRKWSKMMGYGDLKAGEGGADCCRYEWGRDSWPEDPEYPHKGRVQVLGHDAEHYDTDCNNATEAGMNRIFRDDGNVDYGDLDFSIGDLPAGIMSYRGWGACNGWEEFRHIGNAWTNISTPLNTSFILGENMAEGHFYLMFSNVCDTGDWFPINEQGQWVSQCQTTCNNMMMTFVNAKNCNQNLEDYEPGMDRGAIGWIGPSDLDTDTRYNNAVQNAWFESLIRNGYREVGELLTKAKGDLTWIFPNIGQECTFPGCAIGTTMIDYFYSLVYNGNFEPSLPIWTGKPGKMKVVPVDDIITESPWGRWKRRPRHLPNPGLVSDEMPLDVNTDEPISFCVYNEMNTALEGIGVAVVYQKQASYPFDQVYTWQEDMPMGKKNYVSYLLRSEFTDADGCVDIPEIQSSDMFLETDAVDEVGDLIPGSYIQVFLNSETRRTVPLDPTDQYEQRVITYRLQGDAI